MAARFIWSGYFYTLMLKYSAIALLLLSSCSSADSEFCQCLEEGKSLSEYTQKFIDKELSEDEFKKLEELKSAKSSACKEYELMVGAEMRELQKRCEE